MLVGIFGQCTVCVWGAGLFHAAVDAATQYTQLQLKFDASDSTKKQIEDLDDSHKEKQNGRSEPQPCCLFVCSALFLQGVCGPERVCVLVMPGVPCLCMSV